MVRIFAAVKPLSRSIARHPLETWEANILHELLAFGQRVGKTRPLFAQRADRNKVSNHSPERGEPGGDAAVKLRAVRLVFWFQVPLFALIALALVTASERVVRSRDQATDGLGITR